MHDEVRALILSNDLLMSFLSQQPSPQHSNRYTPICVTIEDLKTVFNGFSTSLLSKNR
jgi:hypothetical protein